MKEKGINGHVPKGKKKKEGNCPDAKEKTVEESGTKEKGMKEKSPKEKKVAGSDQISATTTSEKTCEKSDTVVKTSSGKLINPSIIYLITCLFVCLNLCA